MSDPAPPGGSPPPLSAEEEKFHQDELDKSSRLFKAQCDAFREERHVLYLASLEKKQEDAKKEVSSKKKGVSSKKKEVSSEEESEDESEDESDSSGGGDPDDEDLYVEDSEHEEENIGINNHEPAAADCIRSQLEGKLHAVLQLQELAKNMRAQALHTFRVQAKRAGDPKPRIEKVAAELLTKYWRDHAQMMMDH